VDQVVIPRNGSSDVNKLAVVLFEGLLWFEFFGVGYFLIQNLVVTPHLKTDKRVVFSKK
jgi:hypothetical protein